MERYENQNDDIIKRVHHKFTSSIYGRQMLSVTKLMQANPQYFKGWTFAHVIRSSVQMWIDKMTDELGEPQIDRKDVDVIVTRLVAQDEKRKNTDQQRADKLRASQAKKREKKNLKKLEQLRKIEQQAQDSAVDYVNQKIFKARQKALLEASKPKRKRGRPRKEPMAEVK